MKSIMELFRGDAVKFFGINKKIISATTVSAEARTELSHIHIQRNIDDWLLEADDDSFIHFEFQSDYDKEDISRFMISDAILFYSVKKPIKTIVVYTADITETETVLDAGAIQYSVDAFYMSSMDGDKEYAALRAKADAGAAFTKQDLMSIVFIPMMKSGLGRVAQFERSISLSKEVPDKDEQAQIQAMLQLLAEKFVKDSNSLEKLKELLNMGIIGEMIAADAKTDKAIEIAKKMLKRGVSVDIVMEDTGLDESTVLEIQEALATVVAPA
jgi:predicted transposase YdaD